MSDEIKGFKTRSVDIADSLQLLFGRLDDTKCTCGSDCAPIFPKTCVNCGLDCEHMLTDGQKLPILCHPHWIWH